MKLPSLQTKYAIPHFIIFIRSQKSVKIIFEAIWYFPITYKSITADIVSEFNYTLFML